MPEITTRSNTQYALPDDPEQSMYRFILVAAKRARQIQNGARSLLPTINRKPTVTAMEEVRRGLVKYIDIARDGAPPASEQQPQE